MQKLTYKQFKKLMYDKFGLALLYYFNGNFDLTGQIQDGFGGDTPVISYNHKHNQIKAIQSGLEDTLYNKQDVAEIEPYIKAFISTPDEEKQLPWFYRIFIKDKDKQ